MKFSDLISSEISRIIRVGLHYRIVSFILSIFKRQLVIFLKRKIENVAVESSPVGGVWSCKLEYRKNIRNENFSYSFYLFLSS